VTDLSVPDGSGAAGRSALDDVEGQPAAVAQLRAALAAPVHAYLLVGPRGSGKRTAARAFAAELLAAGTAGADAERHRRLALAEAHPDLEVFEREGASISRDQARRVVERAVRSPVEADRKVLLLTEFHLVLDAAPLLLKSIEEPPPSTVFVILADEIPPELVTIASRCLVIRFDALRPEEVTRRLVAEGAPPAVAERAADAAGGDLGRARLLVGDPGLERRVTTWRSVPDRLDGTGAAVVALVSELVGQLDEALVPMDARHRAEQLELVEQAERYSLGRGAGATKAVEDRQRRERRRFRTDELRFGLAVLARSYRDRLVQDLSGPEPPARSALTPFAAIAGATEALERNPNETLLLEGLFLRLRPLA
jgi:DNA polymerase-3 subunit delta'